MSSAPDAAICPDLGISSVRLVHNLRASVVFGLWKTYIHTYGQFEWCRAWMPAACIPVPPNRHENFGLISFVSSRGQEERGSLCQVPSRQFRCLSLVLPSPNPHFNLVQPGPPNRHCHLPGPTNPPALMPEQLKYDRLLFRGEVKMV